MDTVHTKLYINLKRDALQKYFSNLNAMQKRAVFHTEGPLLILAGAGSGKTTVLISRIECMARFGGAYGSEAVPQGLTEGDIAFLRAYIAGEESDATRLAGILAENPVRPWNILAITFTNKAAGELRARLEHNLGQEVASDIQASTFHSLCTRILRREIEALGYGRSFTIYDTDDSLRVIKDAMKALQVDEKLLPARATLSLISRAKDAMQSPGEMLEQAQDDYRLQCVARIYAHYEKTLRVADALDFDDIILNTVRLFQQFPDVLERYRSRYRYIMVDEYQDTNHTQYLLISLLASGHKNLCVVGDDDQSIYKFRGATIENILSFENQFPGALVIRLEQNYRSTQNILSAANKLIAHNTARKGKSLWTDAGDGEKINLLRPRDENEEGNLVASRIFEHVKNGDRFCDHAVLYRMNAQSNSVEKALARHAIPYRVVGGLRFYDRKEIKDIVAYLSVMENPADTLRLLRILNEPKRGIGESTVEAALEIAGGLGIPLFEVLETAEEYPALAKKSTVLKAFAAMLRGLYARAATEPLGDVLDALLAQTGYLKMLESQGFEGAGRIENILELKSNILKYTEENPEPTLSGFLEEIALYTDLDNYDTDADCVVLMTIHSAKGLEFKYVTILGMEEGVFPGRSAMMRPAEIEEERRLAYVAITRAKQELSITAVERRMLFGQTMYGRLSRFVGEIPEEYIVPYVPVRKEVPVRARPAVRRTQAADNSIGIGAMPVAPANAPALQEGDRVLHKVFGEGAVLSQRPMGGDTLLEIAFDTAGTKKIMANFAKLVKVH